MQKRKGRPRASERASERERERERNKVGRRMQTREERQAACPNVRLDDLSTYGKIAFYKLVSRKELEGIADEGGREEAR